MNLIFKPGAERLPISTVLRLSLDTARGLQALHEAPGGAIVHYDLKPDQMMLDGNGTLKISDFNMCRFTDTDAEGKTCPFEAHASKAGVCCSHSSHPAYIFLAPQDSCSGCPKPTHTLCTTTTKPNALESTVSRAHLIASACKIPLSRTFMNSLYSGLPCSL